MKKFLFLLLVAAVGYYFIQVKIESHKTEMAQLNVTKASMLAELQSLYGYNVDDSVNYSFDMVYEIYFKTVVESKLPAEFSGTYGDKFVAAVYDNNTKLSVPIFNIKRGSTFMQRVNERVLNKFIIYYPTYGHVHNVPTRASFAAEVSKFEEANKDINIMNIGALKGSDGIDIGKPCVALASIKNNRVQEIFSNDFLTDEDIKPFTRIGILITCDMIGKSNPY